MSRTKDTAQRKYRSKALPVLGAAGLSLSLATSASAAIGDMNPDTVSQQVMLYEEEIADVSLATFHVFDKERAGIHRPLARLAMGVGGCGCGCAGCGCACGIGLYYHYTPPVLGEPVTRKPFRCRPPRPELAPPTAKLQRATTPRAAHRRQHRQAAGNCVRKQRTLTETTYLRTRSPATRSRTASLPLTASEGRGVMMSALVPGAKNAP